MRKSRTVFGSELWAAASDANAATAMIRTGSLLFIERLVVGYLSRFDVDHLDLAALVDLADGPLYPVAVLI